MNDNEIIKALEMCGNIVVSSCKECSFHISCNANCVKQVMCNALDLINRQKADLKQKDTEIDILIRKREALKDEVAELRAEVERLRGFRKEGFFNLLGNCLVYSKNLKDYNDMRKGLKSEARKEFAERLEEKSIYIPPSSNGKFGVDVVFVEDVYNLLTELTEQ